MGPSSHSQHILSLDSWVQPPEWNFDHKLTMTPNGSPPNPEALEDATIMLSSQAQVTRDIISKAPRLQLVHVNGTGTDHIDKAALKERGILLCHVPAQNTNSVSEHAFALYYSLRRRILPMHQYTMEGRTWATTRAPHLAFGRPTRTNAEETLLRMWTCYFPTEKCRCIIGYGALGKNIESIGKALKMRVIVAERKGSSQARPGRVTFEQALKEATLFILVAPLDDGTRNMIDATELGKMDPSSLIVNVGRGGIIHEAALAEALRSNTIAGAATDVFNTEPATLETSPLLDPSIPNLVLSPHVAWYSSHTIKGTLAMIKANLEGFVAGNPQNLVTS